MKLAVSYLLPFDLLRKNQFQSRNGYAFRLFLSSIYNPLLKGLKFFIAGPTKTGVELTDRERCVIRYLSRLRGGKPGGPVNQGAEPRSGFRSSDLLARHTGGKLLDGQLGPNAELTGTKGWREW